MNPIRTLANFYGRIAYTIGPERWVPLLTRRVLCSVRTTEKKIALTFDDGPNPEYTPLLLTKLAEYRVPATFFLIGRNLERHPEIGRRIVQEGHEVGNHTYHHRILPFSSKANIRNELVCTHQLIVDLLNVQPVCSVHRSAYSPSASSTRWNSWGIAPWWETRFRSMSPGRALKS